MRCDGRFVARNASRTAVLVCFCSFALELCALRHSLCRNVRVELPLCLCESVGYHALLCVMPALVVVRFIVSKVRTAMLPVFRSVQFCVSAIG